MDRRRSIASEIDGRSDLPVRLGRSPAAEPGLDPVLPPVHQPGVEPAHGPLDAESRASPRLVHAILAAGALFGTALVAFAVAPHGLGILQFGFHQIAAAECFRAGEPWILTRGGPYTIWPPLYPVLLAAGREAGLSYPAAALALQLAAHAAILVLAPSLVLRLFGSTPAALACLVLLIVSPWLHESAVALRNEPLMTALLLASVAGLAAWDERPTRGRLILAGVLAALATLQHYKGIALVVPAALWIAFRPGQRLAARLARPAVYAALALVPLSLWMLRNVRLEGGWSGYRYPVDLTFTHQLELAAGTLRDWVYFDPGAGSAPKLAGALAALLLGAVALRPLVRPDARAERRALLVWLAFPVTYVALLFRWAATTSLDAIDARLLSLVQPFFWGTLALGAARSLRAVAGGPARRRAAIVLLLAGFFGLHLASDGSRLVRQIARVRAEGAGGFIGPRWESSGLLAWLRGHQAELATSEVYSNLPELVLFATGRRAAWVDAEEATSVLERAPAGSHVVWVLDLPRAVAAPSLAGTGRELAEVASFETSGVWRVEASR